MRRSTKVIPMASATTSKMVITQPSCFDDVQEIGEYLKQKRTVIVNLESVTKEDHRRIVDFISGATFVAEGSIQKVSTLIYLVTPKTVEIQNDVERAQYRSKMNFSWMK
jgi:cell division inhibitor SepF